MKKMMLLAFAALFGASIVCEKSINMYLATEFSEGGLITLVPGESPGFGRGLVILIFV